MLLTENNFSKPTYQATSAYEIGLAEILKSYQFSLELFSSKRNLDSNDGLKCLLVRDQNSKLAFFLTFLDPKVRGGTFSIENLKYFHEFIDFIEETHSEANIQIPFVFILPSSGVRLTQKRTMFNAVWGILPRLFKLRSQRLFLSVADKLCLGAGALFFGQAHYRIASNPETIINLTGPNVISAFFGSDANFSNYASAGHQRERHLFIHDVASNLEIAIKQCLDLIAVNNKNMPNYSGNESTFGNASLLLNPKVSQGEYLPTSIQKDIKLKELIDQLCEKKVSLFSGYSESGIAYVCKKGNQFFGVLTNPIDHPVNTISVYTIEKYTEALNLFIALNLPLLVVTDTPGGDPRQTNSDSNVIAKTLQLIQKLIDYPYPKVGLIAGRCFGGSGLLALPVVHGSMGLFAIKGSKMGAISDEFIEKLARSQPKYYSEWKVSQASHAADLSDMLESGNLSGIIDWFEISDFVLDFLNGDLSAYQGNAKKI